MKKIRFDVDDRTSDMPVNVLECRADGRHAWTRLADCRPKLSADFAEVTVTRECSVCGTERDDTYALPTMELVGRRMYYQPEYLLKEADRGTGRLPAQRAREALFAHFLNK